MGSGRALELASVGVEGMSDKGFEGKRDTRTAAWRVNVPAARKEGGGRRGCGRDERGRSLASARRESKGRNNEKGSSRNVSAGSDVHRGCGIRRRLYCLRDIRARVSNLTYID
eukprot:6196697-Pleurochrysis_carterae.AAC.1